MARNTSKYLDLVITKCSLTDEYKDKGGGANWYRTRARSSSVGVGCSRGWGAVPPSADGRGAVVAPTGPPNTHHLLRPVTYTSRVGVMYPAGRASLLPSTNATSSGLRAYR